MRKKYDYERKVENVREIRKFHENFERISRKNFNKNFRENERKFLFSFIFSFPERNFRETLIPSLTRIKGDP